ncbi:hypothetical protein EZS27_027033 [termite gut metagenome]|uniref:Uncharacterized protein n=1 Tax=termite gut metagenome TaxID=433724 RepID=A0A5J4QRM9_9ZZZZ
MIQTLTNQYKNLPILFSFIHFTGENYCSLCHKCVIGKNKRGQLSMLTSLFSAVGVRRFELPTTRPQGFKTGKTTVTNLLSELGHSLQSNRKGLEGKSHPDRNAQFEFINSCDAVL